MASVTAGLSKTRLHTAAAITAIATESASVTAASPPKYCFAPLGMAPRVG
jgi:hypothetical protein